MNHLTEAQILDCRQAASNQGARVRITEYEIEASKAGTSIYDGMQVLFEDGVYEVSQFQAGRKQDELHIYTETKSLKIAIRSLLNGNKVSGRNRRPIKIWDNSPEPGPRIMAR